MLISRLFESTDFRFQVCIDAFNCSFQDIVVNRKYDSLTIQQQLLGHIDMPVSFSTERNQLNSTVFCLISLEQIGYVTQFQSHFVISGTLILIASSLVHNLRESTFSIIHDIQIMDSSYCNLVQKWCLKSDLILIFNHQIGHLIVPMLKWTIKQYQNRSENSHTVTCDRDVSLSWTF